MSKDSAMELVKKVRAGRSCLDSDLASFDEIEGFDAHLLALCDLVEKQAEEIERYKNITAIARTNWSMSPRELAADVRKANNCFLLYGEPMVIEEIETLCLMVEQLEEPSKNNV